MTSIFDFDIVKELYKKFTIVMENNLSKKREEIIAKAKPDLDKSKMLYQKEDECFQKLKSLKESIADIANEIFTESNGFVKKVVETNTRIIESRYYADCAEIYALYEYNTPSGKTIFPKNENFVDLPMQTILEIFQQSDIKNALLENLQSLITTKNEYLSKLESYKSELEKEKSKFFKSRKNIKHYTEEIELLEHTVIEYNEKIANCKQTILICDKTVNYAIEMIKEYIKLDKELNDLRKQQHDLDGKKCSNGLLTLTIKSMCDSYNIDVNEDALTKFAKHFITPEMVSEMQSNNLLCQTMCGKGKTAQGVNSYLLTYDRFQEQDAQKEAFESLIYSICLSRASSFNETQSDINDQTIFDDAN